MQNAQCSFIAQNQCCEREKKGFEGYAKVDSESRRREARREKECACTCFGKNPDSLTHCCVTFLFATVMVLWGKKEGEQWLGGGGGGGGGRGGGGSMRRLGLSAQ